MSTNDTSVIGRQGGALRTSSRAASVAALAVLMALSILAGQASAATGGYPYASYRGPGSHPSQYEWTDSRGNPISPYGYYYRNCTDFAAWKLATTNKFSGYRGLGNGGTWGSRARQRHYKVDMSPKPGAIAWWSPSGGLGRFGHVAWVESVKGSSVTIQEYNYRVPASPGTWDRRTISRTSVSGYIHFKDLKPSVPKPSKPKTPTATATPAGAGDSVGYYDPADYSFHLINGVGPGPSDYAFVRGKPGVIPLVGNWDGK